ncbi:MAG: hypothetical protein WBQ55_04390 [Xanthobacteraceae bacterium]
MRRSTLLELSGMEIYEVAHVHRCFAGELAWRGRVDYPALKAKVQVQAKTWKATRVLVEDTGAGTALVQELHGQVSGIIAITPKGDKASRMAVASTKIDVSPQLKVTITAPKPAQVATHGIALLEFPQSARLGEAQ